MIYEQITKEEIQSKIRQGWKYNRMYKHYTKLCPHITKELINNVIQHEVAKNENN